MRKLATKIVTFGITLLLAGCAAPSFEDELDVTASAQSSSGWPYPVPTGCVALASDPSRCRTNIGYYDVTQATASLDANMKAAGYTKQYSPLCRTNTGYVKGSTKVCYNVGVVQNSTFQAIGSQWNGRKG